jgi:ribosome-associated protein
MISSDRPENDAPLEEEESTQREELDASVEDAPEQCVQPDDFEDEVEVIYVGAPTQFYDPDSIGDPSHDAPRPSTIPRRERRAEIRDQFEILREAAKLSKGRMEQLSLPGHLRELLSEVKAAEEHKGSRRFIRAQLSRLTEEDTEVLADALDRLPELDRDAAERAKRAESWTKVLLEGGKAAQTQFFEAHQDQTLDHQGLRSLIRQAAKNTQKLGFQHDKSKRSLKDLRKSLRGITLKPCSVQLAPREE